MSNKATAIVDIIIHLKDHNISTKTFEDALSRWSYPWTVKNWRMIGDTVAASIRVTDSCGYTKEGISLCISNALKNKEIPFRSVVVQEIKHGSS